MKSLPILRFAFENSERLSLEIVFQALSYIVIQYGEYFSTTHTSDLIDWDTYTGGLECMQEVNMLVIKAVCFSISSRTGGLLVRPGIPSLTFLTKVSKVLRSFM
ncbi:hypothetical protein EWB00_008922 [Schistosoma japonicum]|uniref:Uncharacterized protein n=1 Tax=Schistosoma japonicum TaxID=6182 RepID=A0A4Z2DSD6_SCHJA|nr:hypothetical protein EWB00_008922 [Schistosoma japonicum]